MRKAVIEIVPNKFVRHMQKGIYDSVEKMLGRELIKLDFEKLNKLVICDFIMRPGHTFDDIDFPEGVEILNILRVEGTRYTVLLSARAPSKKFKFMFKMFDLNVIYDTPFEATSDKIIFSAIGETEQLNKLVKLVKFIGEVKNVSITPATFSEHDLLNVLTDKQKEIIIQAKKNGYYQYPRKINTRELSEKLGISKATTVEHLRKAEIRLVSNLLAGY